MNKGSKKNIFYIILVILTLVFLFPILVVIMNSFKGQLYISRSPFSFPLGETFASFSNYVNGFNKIGFGLAFLYSLIITIGSVAVIILFCSMTAWYITRLKNKATMFIYYLFVFSMIVPFQMIMFVLSKITDIMHLGNPIGIIPVYLGFGAGLSVFMYSGFVKGIPIEIEEASMIDGCNPIQSFFIVVFPILKPISITIAILNTMWIWNDYLLPTLVLNSKYRTIPIAIQYLKGGYGSKDMGALMAMLVLAIIPIIIFYLTCQKYIVKGVVAGAVKG